MCIDIAGVLFTVGPFGGIAAFKEMVADLADAAGTGSALAAHIAQCRTSPVLRFGMRDTSVFTLATVRSSKLWGQGMALLKQNWLAEDGRTG